MDGRILLNKSPALGRGGGGGNHVIPRPVAPSLLAASVSVAQIISRERGGGISLKKELFSSFFWCLSSPEFSGKTGVYSLT